MISEKLVKAINDQIIAELWSSSLYLQMAFFLKKEGWNGSAHWMLKQSAEEKDHALALADYVIKRGGEANVGMIDVVPQGWGSLQDVKGIRAALCSDTHAAEMTRRHNNANILCLGGLVTEEKTALEIVDRLRKAGEAGAFFVDAELGKR